MDPYIVLNELYAIFEFALKLYGFYTLILLSKALKKYLKNKNQDN